MKTKDGTFSVMPLYTFIEPKRSVSFPKAVVWNAWVPPKACFFTWEASWGKVLILDQLQRRGFSLSYQREVN